MSSDPSQELAALDQEAHSLRNRLWRMGITLTSFANFLTERYLGLEVKEAGVQPPAFWPHRRGAVALSLVKEAMNLQETLEFVRRYYELEEKRHGLCGKLGRPWSPVLP